MNVLTITELAELWGIKASSLRDAAIGGRLPAKQSGRTWLVDVDDPKVQAYKDGYTPKIRRSQADVGTCPVCGNPLPRRRSIYCSQKCYGVAKKEEEQAARSAQ